MKRKMKRGWYVAVTLGEAEIWYKMRALYAAVIFQQRHEYDYGLASHTARFIKGRRVK